MQRGVAIVDEEGWQWYDEALDTSIIHPWRSEKDLYEAIYLSTLLLPATDRNGTCPICTESGSTSEEGILLKHPGCPHHFHCTCFMKCAMNGVVECPLCRERIIYEGSSIRNRNLGISHALRVPISDDCIIDVPDDVIEERRVDLMEVLFAPGP